MDVRGLVDAARVGRLGTVSAQGEPHLVPVCFALIGNTVYHAVDHKPKRGPDLRRIANIQATHRATLLFDEYRDDDWSALWWVRLDGTARLVPGDISDDSGGDNGADSENDRGNDRGDERATALDALAARYAQYRAIRPAGPVIAVDVTRWSGWSARHDR